MLLLTGSQGYVATHFKKYLNPSHKVISLDLNDGADYQCSIEDLAMSCPKIKKITHVIHLADEKLQDLNESNWKPNANKHQIFFENLKSLPQIENVIFASSCSVYGFTESLIDENSPIRPTSWYAQSKMETEASLKKSGLPYTILRFGTAFGGVNNIRYDLFVNQMIKSIQKSSPMEIFGLQAIRPYVEVRDFAKALMFFLAQPALFETINVAEFNASKIELLKTLHGLGIATPNLALNQYKSDSRNYYVTKNKLNSTGFQFEYTSPTSIQKLAEHHGIL